MNIEITNARKWTILFIASLSTFMATLDGSIVNIALPMISGQMKVSISAIQWVVTSYLLTISILLLVWGKLSDIYGKKYIFSSGFIVFAVGSLLCSFSRSLDILVAARVLQAVGASSMMSLSQGIVTGTFPPSERGRALGFVGTMVALGSLAGPSLGGILVHIFGWPSIFIINVPIGVVGCILAFTIIPEMFERQKDKTYDYKGTGLFALFVLVLFLGLLLVQQGILPVLLVIPTIIVAAFVMWILIMVEKRSTNPIINLQLFGIHEFSFGLSAAFFSFIAINSTLLFMPFYLQNLMGYSALKAGLIISAYPVTLAIIAPISGWLSDKITYRPLTIAGMAVTVVSLILLATINRTTPIPVMILYMILLGGGIGIFQSPNNSSIMGSVPRAQLGVAGGLNALFRNLGMVSGTTFSVLIFSFVTKLSINSVTYGVFNKASFVKGLSGVFIFDAVCCFLAVAISLFRAASIKPGSEKAAREAKINGARPL